MINLPKKTAAVVPAKGLGDGLLYMIIAHNLRTLFDVTTFSDPLSKIARWFPDENISEKTDNYADFTLVISAESNPISHPNLLVIKESDFDKTKTMVENLTLFCKKKLKLESAQGLNGLKIPSDVRPYHFSKRIAIHPESSSSKKNWPKEKYVQLYEKLKLKDWHPVICVGKHERFAWEKYSIELPYFNTLDEFVSFVAESQVFIGNDSGIGHFASNINIPTLTIFARKSYSKLWRPGWGRNIVVCPPNVLPGIKLKQKYWKRLLSVKRVLRIWESNTSASPPTVSK